MDVGCCAAGTAEGPLPDASSPGSAGRRRNSHQPAAATSASTAAPPSHQPVDDPDDGATVSVATGDDMGAGVAAGVATGDGSAGVATGVGSAVTGEGVAAGLGRVPGVGVGVGAARGVGVAPGRGVGRATGAGLDRGVGVATGGGTGSGAGVGAGPGACCAGDRLKLSSPGMVCGEVVFDVCATPGAAAAPATKRATALSRAPRFMFMYPDLTQNACAFLSERFTTATLAATNRPGTTTGRSHAMPEGLDTPPLTAPTRAPISVFHHSFRDMMRRRAVHRTDRGFWFIDAEGRRTAMRSAFLRRTSRPAPGVPGHDIPADARFRRAGHD